MRAALSASLRAISWMALLWMPLACTTAPKPKSEGSMAQSPAVKVPYAGVGNPSLTKVTNGPNTPSGPSAKPNKVYYHAAQPPPGGTQKWNPLWWMGNADDPIPPDWYRPGQSLRNLLWQLRNPMHNFTFYVIGVNDKEFVRKGRDPSAVFRREGGWNWAMIHAGPLRLPFISYQGRHFRAYALWREKGNFGLKFHRVKAVKQIPPHSKEA